MRIASIVNLLLSLALVTSIFASSAVAQNSTAPSSTSEAPPPTSSAPPPSSESPPPPPASDSPPPPPPPCSPEQPCPPPPDGHQCPPDQACPPPPPPGGYQCPPDQPCGPPPGGYQCQPGQPCGPPPGGYQCQPGQPCGPPPGGRNDPYGRGPHGDQPACPYPCDNPPPEERCWGKMESIRPELDQIMRQGADFHRQFAEARRAFESSFREKGTYPTHEDWDQFHAGFQEKAKAHFEAQRAKLEAFLKEQLGDCADMMPLPLPPIPDFAGGPRGPPPGMDARRGPPMQGGHFEFNEAAEKIRMECEARVRALFESRSGPSGSASDFQSPDGSTEPRPAPRGPGYGGGPTRMDPALERQAHEIMRECERKIREQFQDEHREDFEDESFGSFEMYFDEESGLIQVAGRYLALKGNPESQQIQDVSCAGQLFLDQLYANGYLAEFSPEETKQGTALMISDSGGKRVLSIHDNPRCVINVAATSEIPSLTFVVSDYLECEASRSGDWVCSDGEGVELRVLLHKGDATVDGNTFEVDGKATFIVHAQDAEEDLGSDYQDAVLSKKVGGEVKIKAGKDGLAVDAVPIGDLEIEIDSDENEITANIESENGEGKTVVLEIAGDVFEYDTLVIQVAALTGTKEEDLAAQEASDLSDILDPLDDGDAVEYWVVSDKNGWHVLVSFPHFSEKKVTIQSVEGEDVGNGLLPGFELAMALGVLGVVAVAVGLRRRNE